MRIASGVILPRLGLALLSAFIVSGCGSEPAKVTAPPPSDVVSSVSLSRAAIHPGEITEITVVVTNPNAQTVTLHFASGCMIMFAVRDAQGDLAAPKTVLCTLNTPSLELGPHESATRKFMWDGTEGAPGTQLLPGDYTVTGGLEPGVVRAPSPPVAIRILGP